jgi:hypothetical protein
MPDHETKVALIELRLDNLESRHSAHDDKIDKLIEDIMRIFELFTKIRWFIYGLIITELPQAAIAMIEIIKDLKGMG